MLFEYPDRPLVRRHGPAGYARYQYYKPWLRDEFQFRCVYCLTRERWANGGHRAFSVEHIIPRERAPSLELDYENLAYACQDCNSERGAKDLPLDPRTDLFRDHLRFEANGGARGLTREGKDMIAIFGFNEPDRTHFRETLLQTLPHCWQAHLPTTANCSSDG